ncbi:MAG TPA: hypothetical protein VH328_01150, partial [Burkholderiaceae bacterium]|nr:hypothetical protein [Burkholderiaceae bacterium]
MASRQRFTALALAVLAFCAAWPAHAQQAAGDEDLRSVVKDLQRQLDELKARLQASEGAARTTQASTPVQAGAGNPVVAGPAAAAPGPAAADVRDAFVRKPGEGFTILTRGGEATLYGVLDVSVDDSSKGLGGMSVGGAPPVGRTGWVPDISGNLSYVGLRGFQSLGDGFPANFVYQLETQIDISASSGLSASNSNS